MTATFVHAITLSITILIISHACGRFIIWCGSFECARARASLALRHLPTHAECHDIKKEKKMKKTSQYLLMHSNVRAQKLFPIVFTVALRSFVAISCRTLLLLDSVSDYKQIFFFLFASRLEARVSHMLNCGRSPLSHRLCNHFDCLKFIWQRAHVCRLSPDSMWFSSFLHNARDSSELDAMNAGRSAMAL